MNKQIFGHLHRVAIKCLLYLLGWAVRNASV